MKKKHQRLKRLRTETGLTQKQLAQLAGIPVPTLVAIEVGARRMTLEIAEQISAATGAAAHSLLATSGYPTDFDGARYTPATFSAHRSKYSPPAVSPGSFEMRAADLFRNVDALRDAKRRRAWSEHRALLKQQSEMLREISDQGVLLAIQNNDRAIARMRSKKAPSALPSELDRKEQRLRQKAGAIDHRDGRGVDSSQALAAEEATLRSAASVRSDGGADADLQAAAQVEIRGYEAAAAQWRQRGDEETADAFMRKAESLQHDVNALAGAVAAADHTRIQAAREPLAWLTRDVGEMELFKASAAADIENTCTALRALLWQAFTRHRLESALVGASYAISRLHRAHALPAPDQSSLPAMPALDAAAVRSPAAALKELLERVSGVPAGKR